MASIPALGDNFNDPQSDDTTSAPAMPQPQVANTLAQVLKNKGKKKNPRTPAPLASAISRSKRARQFGDKFGS